jgi:hypothetical protein
MVLFKWLLPSKNTSYIEILFVPYYSVLFFLVISLYLVVKKKEAAPQDQQKCVTYTQIWLANTADNRI